MATATIIKPPERVNLISSKQNKKPVNLDSIEALTRETDKMVQGTFLNVEYPGQPAKICGKYYRGMEYFSKTFLDGERCTIPLSVARFINERCFYVQHKHLKDDKGQDIKDIKAIPRYKFMAEF
jgi:hypothetical protein